MLPNIILKTRLNELLPGREEADIAELMAELDSAFKLKALQALDDNSLIFICRQWLEKGIPPMHTVLTPVIAMSNLDNNYVQKISAQMTLDSLEYNRLGVSHSDRKGLVH